MYEKISSKNVLAAASSIRGESSYSVPREMLTSAIALD